MSSHKRSNAVISLNVNGVPIEGVPEVRHNVFQYFKNYFRRSQFIRPDIGGLVFNSISVEEGADLIQTFLLEEIKDAIWDCDSFKSSAPMV